MKTLVLEIKGKGHPDQVCDELANVAIGYIDEFNEKYSKLNFYIHANFDKCYLKSSKYPMFRVAGNASYDFKRMKDLGIDRDEIFKDIERRVVSAFKSIFPNALLKVEFDISFNRSKLEKSTREQLSNDTSYVVSYYPLRKEEQAMLMLRDHIESITYAGYDFKILLAGDRLYISQCFMKPDVSEVKTDENSDLFNLYNERQDAYYQSYVDDITTFVSKLDIDVTTIIVNNDMNKFGFWWNKFGSSVFHDDCGMVGRGNDIFGFTCNLRPANNEAFSGKNKNHPAMFLKEKAYLKAKEVFEETGKPVTVTAVSVISDPIDQYKLITQYNE